MNGNEREMKCFCKILRASLPKRRRDLFSSSRVKKSGLEMVGDGVQWVFREKTFLKNAIPGEISAFSVLDHFLPFSLLRFFEKLGKNFDCSFFVVFVVIIS
jgi:hypothetical protein